MSTPTNLPILALQPTFPEVVADVLNGVVADESFWLSCYTEAPTGLHAKVRVSLDETDRSLVRLDANEGFQVKGTKYRYSVSSAKQGIPETPILVPTHQFADPHRANPQHACRTSVSVPSADESLQPHRITAFDVAPDGTQFATGFLDGSVHIYGVHKSTTTSLEFFPSSRVLLSAGADFTLCILPADPAPPSSALAPVRTMTGHARTITKTAIVSRGRNVVSASLDGTIRLWDVSSGAQIHMLTPGGGRLSPITSISLGERAGTALPSSSPHAAMTDPREVDTASKLLFCALQTKTFEAIDLGSRETVFTSPAAASALTSIAYAPTENLLATGSSKGIVDVYDTRSLDTKLASFTRGSSQAGIADLSWAAAKHLLIGTDDGLPYIGCISGESLGVRVAGELVGADTDAVRVLRSVGGNVWTAADDGVVRRYALAA
ncbi:WD40 repeat-like protein [Mycena kentingensis (nom. inval.)]|nr:WD40 repeat-like protein [Mycena kentingensis (nom. inval.)]